MKALEYLTTLILIPLVIILLIVLSVYGVVPWTKEAHKK